MQNNRVELLAPAGNMDGFYGAIHAGADAVYLGGSRFGARAYADNFTTQELIDCIRYAHLWGRKVYLTVNTLVKEHEFSDIYEYLLPYYEAGLDGVIIQDIGVFCYVRDHFPGMELHISTQMTLTGVHGAAMLRDMGACRIVPARELSLSEIAYMKEKTGLSIEVFVHGAMCYCYSGQCLFSSILGGRSGNRGRCAQPCRLPYEVKVQQQTSGECYPLSLKDMCTIEHIPELIDAGIDSFKIEGRMKKPEYTAGVTAIYRKYIDKYYEYRKNSNPNERLSVNTYNVDASDMKDLSCLYIRSERQDGYYFKHNGKDMVTLKDPSYSGSDEALLTRIRHDYLDQKPKQSIAIYADFTVGQKAQVTIVLDDISVTAKGDVVQIASKQPITKENIAKQLNKLGDSIFEAKIIESHVSENAFYPLRAINELRRDAVALLEEQVILKNGFPLCRLDAVRPETKYFSAEKTVEQHCGMMIISIRRKEQLTAVLNHLTRQDSKNFAERIVKRIYIDSDLLIREESEIIAQCRKLVMYCEVVISFPYIIRKKDAELIEDKLFRLLEEYSEIFSGVQVRSMEGMGILKDKDYLGKIYTDAGFYVWNKQSLEVWRDTISGFCMPLELKNSEQRNLLPEDIDCEKIVYGRIPMMITANCVAKTTSGCRKKSGEGYAELTDRYRKIFPVELNCTHCMNIIYNSVPLSLHREMTKWKREVDFRLDFTVETKDDTEKVIDFFGKLIVSDYTELQNPPYKDYTTGHEKRGAE